MSFTGPPLAAAAVAQFVEERERERERERELAG
jgi:hypothetical protein